MELRAKKLIRVRRFKIQQKRPCFPLIYHVDLESACQAAHLLFPMTGILWQTPE